jgi:hypothetical protein
MPLANLSIIVKMSGGMLPANSRAGDLEIYDNGKMLIYESDTDIVERMIPRDKILNILQTARQSGFFQLDNIMHDGGNAPNVPDVTISLNDSMSTATVTATGYQKLKGEMRKNPFDITYKLITDMAWESYNQPQDQVAAQAPAPTQTAAQPLPPVPPVPQMSMPPLPTQQKPGSSGDFELPSLDDLLKSSGLDFSNPSTGPKNTSGALPPLQMPPVPSAGQANNAGSLPPLSNFAQQATPQAQANNLPPLNKPTPAPAMQQPAQPKPPGMPQQTASVQQPPKPQVAPPEPPKKVEARPEPKVQPQQQMQPPQTPAKTQPPTPQQNQGAPKPQPPAPKPVQQPMPAPQNPVNAAQPQARPNPPAPVAPAMNNQEQQRPPMQKMPEQREPEMQKPKLAQAPILSVKPPVQNESQRPKQNPQQDFYKKPAVGWDHTQELIGRLEETLKSKFLVFYASDSHEVSVDDMRYLYAHLRRVGNKKSLTVLAVIKKGQLPIVWRMATLLREFCQEMIVVVPEASSVYTTMLSLAGDQILMNPLGYLSPIETAFSHPLLHPGLGDGAEIPLTEVLQASVIGNIEKTTKTKTDSSNNDQGSNLNPLVVTAAQRQFALTQMLCTNLLKLGKKSAKADAENTKIVEQLTKGYPSQDYPITFGEVKSMGLNVSETSEEMNDLLWELLHHYQYITQPVMLVRDGTKSEEQQAAIIESDGRRTLYYKELHEDTKNSRVIDQNNRWREVTKQLSIEPNGKDKSQLVWKDLQISGHKED